MFKPLDIQLMEKLMSRGIDEARAAAIIGETDCPYCDVRLDPWIVKDIRDRKGIVHIFVAYTCPECDKKWLYDATIKLLVKPPRSKKPFEHKRA